MALIPNRGPRTVLKYTKLEFQGDWEYHFDEYSYRPVKPTAVLLVVSEAPTGFLTTHWFSVRRRPDPGGGGVYTTDNVIVPDKTNIVYIPERCVRREAGDKTTCGGPVLPTPRPDDGTKRQKKRKRSRR
jgi:hypothetical protein